MEIPITDCLYTDTGPWYRNSPYLDMDPIVALFFGHEIQLLLVHAGMLARPVVGQEQPEQEPQQATTTWRVQWNGDTWTREQNVPQATCSNTFSWTEISTFWFNFDCSLFRRAHLIMSQHWFRLWFGIEYEQVIMHGLRWTQFFPNL